MKEFKKTEITPELFLEAKYNLPLKAEVLNQFTLIELAEILEEYEQVKERINYFNSPYDFLDEKAPTLKQWIDYNERYQDWRNSEFESDMDRAMSKPNHPNYVRANND
jgi:hypothetical protein